MKKKSTTAVSKRRNVRRNPRRSESHAADEHARLNQAAMLHLAGQFDEAQRAYEALLIDEPFNATALNNLGFLHAQRASYDEAIDLYRRALEIAPDRSMLCANLGQSLAAVGRIDAARAALERAVDLDARNVAAWDSLGSLHLQAGRWAEAQSAWRKARAVAPLEPRFALGLATALAGQGRIDEAAHVLRHIADAAPQRADLWSQLGVVLLLRQDFGSAADALTTALRLAPGDVDTRHRLAQAHLAAGRREEARMELERVLAQQPRHAPAALDLAVMDIATNEPGSALERLEQVAADEPHNAKAAFYRGVALEQLSRSRDARAVLAQVVAGGSPYAARAEALLAKRPV